MSLPDAPPPYTPAADVVTPTPAPQATGGWGSHTVGGGGGTAKFALQQAPAYPCLDVLYPGKFRFHCQRCRDDVAISKFTRHRFYMFYGFTETGGEKLYRLPMALANSYVEGCARGRFQPGAFIRAGEETVVSAGAPLDSEAYALQEHDDSPAALAKQIVDNKFELFADGKEVYVLQALRVPPYLVVVHESAMPSATDVAAYENNYSLQFIQKLDADYDEALQKSFRK